MRARSAALPLARHAVSVTPKGLATTLFHIALLRDWHAAERSGGYEMSTRGLTLAEVGFIHASFEHQVTSVGTVVYADSSEPLVVLVIDRDRLDVPVVIENLDGGDEVFPHIYGPLPTDAVVAVLPASIDGNGNFTFGD